MEIYLTNKQYTPIGLLCHCTHTHTHTHTHI